jgi:hypothetical protein
MISSFATSLPENSNDGYVAAAYIVFLAIVLVYVAIMAIRLGRVERKVEELRGEEKDGPLARAREASLGEDPNALDRPHAEGASQERTPMGTPHGGVHPEGHKQAGETV